MDITCECKNCGQHIVIDESGAGASVSCPNCQKKISIPERHGVNSRACPHCGSLDIIKASAAHQQGTSFLSGQQTQIGAILGSDANGDLEIDPVITAGRFQGTQQTTLARKLSPPSEPEDTNRWGGWLAVGIGLLVVSIVWIIVAQAFASVTLWVTASAAIVTIVTASINIPKERVGNAAVRVSYRRALQRWATLWYCKRCGESFQLN